MMPDMHPSPGARGMPPVPLPLGDAVAAPQNSQALFAWYAPGFSDALGDRLLLFDNTDGRPLELLRLRPDFERVDGFEASVRERALDLAAFVDPRFARVCRVDRLPDPGGGLAIVSEHVEGTRLSEVLALARRRRARLTADLALTLVGDLVSAIAALHQQGPALAHGAISPERLVVGPRGHLVVTEYVLGTALRRAALARPDLCLDLPLGPERTHPSGAGNQRGDVVQIGMTAVALLVGHAVDGASLPAALAEAGEGSRAVGWGEGRWTEFRGWLDRALQIDREAGFANAVDASVALESLGSGLRLIAAAPALAHFVAECGKAAASPSGEVGSAEVGSNEEWQPSAAVGPERPAAVHPPAVAAQTGVPDGADVRAVPMADRRTVRPVADDERREAFQAGTAGRRTILSSALAGGHRTAAMFLLVVLAVLALAEAVYIGNRFLAAGGRDAPSTATLRLDSSPSAATVSIDGKAAGLTPAVIGLRPGRHTIEVATGGRRRVVPLTLEAGATLSQFIELPSEASGLGRIDVRTEPPGARVTVDGQPRGVSPLLVGGLAVGTHEVRVDVRGHQTVQAVNVEDSGTTNVFVPLAGGTTPARGGLSIVSPLELQVYEDEHLLGTSESERIVLPAGRHELSLVNEAVGFHVIREVAVPAGRTEEIEVALPNGTVDINASPWAEVSIDGEKIGETPLAGITARLGHHRVTFRHPTLGERSVDCLVTLRQPARVTADLRK